MSEFENDEKSIETTEQAEVTPTETEDTEVETQSQEEKTEQDSNDVLFDKANKAARLLRARRAVLRREQEDNEGKSSVLVRALKLLQLKPKMEQKEVADLLGVRLRELDAVMAEAEKQDLVARIEPDEPDMRKIVIMADADAVERAEALEAKGEDLVPGLAQEDLDQLLVLLDKVIDPLVALGLDEDRTDKRDDRGGRGGFRGGHDRGDRGGSRGGFGGRDDRGGRGGFRGGRDRDDRGGSRGGYGSRDDRGSRGSYGSRDDRGGRSGGYRGGNRDRDDRGHGDRRGYGSSSRGGDRGGYRGGRDDRGGRSGGYRGGSSRY